MLSSQCEHQTKKWMYVTSWRLVTNHILSFNLKDMPLGTKDFILKTSYLAFS